MHTVCTSVFVNAGAIYSDWTDKRQSTTQPFHPVTPQTSNDVTIGVPSSCRFLSIADLNLTNSMTSLLQNGSRMTGLHSEPVLVTSLNALSLKSTNSSQQRRRRHKKVTPHVQDTRGECFKVNAIEQTASATTAVPSGESIKTNNSNRSIYQGTHSSSSRYHSQVVTS